MRPLILGTLLPLLTGAAVAQEVAPVTATPVSTSTIGVARANAARVDLAQRAQQQLDALPDDVKQDLIKRFDAEKTALDAKRQQATAAQRKSHSADSQNTLKSIANRFTAIEESRLYVTDSIATAPEATPPVTAPAAASPAPLPVITYKPEILLPTLNPSFAICGDGVWNKPSFPYQSQLDRNAAALKQLSLSVGLFKSYVQRNKPGLPGVKDVILPVAGTGVAIGSDIVLTNQHVAANMVVDPAETPSTWQLNSTKQRFIIWFPVETSACAAVAKTAAFEVVQLIYAGLGPDQDDDIAVLKVQPLDGGTLQPISFAENSSYAGAQYLGVIGYPDQPSPSDYVPPNGNGLFKTDDALDAYFDLPDNMLPKYQIERFGFGRLVDLNDPELRVIGHDAPTDNSSSGSLVVALASGKPIALHAGGNLGAGVKSGVNIAFRGDYIVAQLRSHGVLTN